MTLAKNLAPDAKPVVRIVGAIEDLAGNATTSGEVKAQDFIAPGPTVVSVTPALQKANSDVVIRIAADEDLRIEPTVKVTIIDTASPGTPLTTTLTASEMEGVSRAWEARFSSSTSHAFNVFVSGVDTSGNASKAGVEDNEDPKADTAVLFEIDGDAPDATTPPTFRPADGAQIQNLSPFLAITFSGEGAEYDGDTHEKVTLTKLELDGIDVLSQALTRDIVNFSLVTSDLGGGAHTLVVRTRDEVGNSMAAERKITFTVIGRPPYEIPLVPGDQLISLPGAPSDTSLDGVLAGTDVTQILPMSPWIPTGLGCWP